MNFFKGLYNKAESYVLSKAPLGKVMIEAALRRGADDRISGKLELSARNIQAQTLKKYKTAIAAATDPENPDWTQLAEFYYNLMIDNHLASVIDSRILYCQ